MCGNRYEVAFVKKHFFSEHAFARPSPRATFGRLDPAAGYPTLHMGRHHPFTDLKALDVGADSDDLADPVGYRGQRQTHLWIVSPLYDQQISEVQRYGAHAHDYLARCRHRRFS